MRTKQQQRDRPQSEANTLRQRLKEATRRKVPETQKTIHEIGVSAISDRLSAVGRELKALE